MRWGRLALAAAAAAAVLVFATGGGARTVHADRIDPAIHKIKHVVVIMQENRSFDSYFGTFPGADGIPMKAGVPTVCVPDPAKGGCQRPYHDPSVVNAGGPHNHVSALGDVERRRDGRVRAGRPRRRRRRARARQDPDVPERRRDRRDGLPRPARDPELLGVRAELRPAGPHVRAGLELEPAGAPVHGLRVVGDLLRLRRPDELRQREREPGQPAGHGPVRNERAGPGLRAGPTSRTCCTGRT